MMGSTVTVRNIDPAGKSWLGREARHVGVSMEEKREAGQSVKPSEAFKRYFGPEHGVELPLPDRYRYRHVEFASESKR